MQGCQTGCCHPSPSDRRSLVVRSAAAVAAAVAVGDDGDGGCGGVAGDSAAVVESVVAVVESAVDVSFVRVRSPAISDTICF